MEDQYLTIREASRLLGVSLDTIRRWDTKGKLETIRSSNNQRMVPISEVRRLMPKSGNLEKREVASARNRIVGTVTKIKTDGLLAQIEVDVTDPARLVAIITKDAATDLNLAVGSPVVAVVKATSMMIDKA